ncbi:hypothetical protein GCM10009773_12810 [Williamsia serinedens]
MVEARGGEVTGGDRCDDPVLGGVGLSGHDVTVESRTDIVARSSGKWHDGTMSDTVVIGRQGRIVIPSDIRAELGLSAGDSVRVVRDGRRIVLERPDDAVDDLRGLLADGAGGRSLVAELLAERIAEADGPR